MIVTLETFTQKEKPRICPGYIISFLEEDLESFPVHSRVFIAHHLGCFPTA
jgi:hypothetical protein